MYGVREVIIVFTAGTVRSDVVLAGFVLTTGFAGWFAVKSDRIILTRV